MLEKITKGILALVGVILMMSIQGLIILVTLHVLSCILVLSCLYKKHVALKILTALVLVATALWDAMLLYAWFGIHILGLPL